MLNTVDDKLNQQINGWVGVIKSYFGLSDTLSMLAVTSIIFGVGLLSFYVVRPIILNMVDRVSKRERFVWLRAFHQNHVFHRILLLIPGIVIYFAIPLVTLLNFPFASLFAKAIEMGAKIYIACIVTSALSALLNSIETRFRHFSLARKYSIKSYIQVGKILLYCLTTIVVVSILIDQSPMYLLTGLGAMTAVIMLIFRDSILGFVASIQLNAYDMVRIGDWIEMPKYGADGDVIDISLNTIKIQNFDKTIVTIPSYAILTDGIKNWRGMSESGGRRIKRSINIDVNSVHMCSNALLEKLSQLPLIQDELLAQINDNNRYIDAYAAKLLHGDTRCVTNLAIFRMYLEAFLRNHPNIHADMSFLVRELQDTGKGLPIEIYIFSNVINWAKYEAIQADIFDYIYAVMPLFELRPYQTLSGTSLELRMRDVATA